ncbi:MAG: RNA methyltransferase [Rhodocyclaceae bacterium]|nr:RNA methyltransferase [Rhodocyclaceae bacterium]
MKIIASRDNPTFKALRDLSQDPREQRKQGKALIDGPHLLQACRDQGGRPELVVVSEDGLKNAEVQFLLTAFDGVEVLCFRNGLFKEVSGIASPVGILAVISIPAVSPRGGISGSCVVLDGLQDAGNVGSILRTAAAAGVRDVILGVGCAGAWTPKVLRAGQGAHFCLTIREQVNLLEFLTHWGGTTIATVARDGQSLFDLKLTSPIAWLFGAEGRGLAPDLVARAGIHAVIPMAAGSESLNVASAAAVCLFEELRQHLQMT